MLRPTPRTLRTLALAAAIVLVASTVHLLTEDRSPRRARVAARGQSPPVTAGDAAQPPAEGVVTAVDLGAAPSSTTVPKGKGVAPPRPGATPRPSTTVAAGHQASGPAPVVGAVAGQGLYVVDADGRNLRQLTNRNVDSQFPAWSPDSRHLAFERQDSATPKLPDDFHLCVLDADGANGRRLPGHGGSDVTWSPKGDRIAYSAPHTNDHHRDLVTVDASGAPGTTEVAVDGIEPAWSPDGARLAYDNAATTDVVVNTGGSETVVVPKTGGRPRLGWSPDGSRLALDSGRVAQADGSGSTAWAGASAWGGAAPTWAPDGNSLLYVDGQNGDTINGDPAHVKAVNPDGSGARLVADDALQPLWSAASGWVSIVNQGPRRADGSHASDLQLIRPDGSARHTVVVDPPGWTILTSAWSPDGTKVAFAVVPSASAHFTDAPLNSVC